MQTTTVLLIVLAALVSFAIAWYQYLYRKKQDFLNRTLAVLRFGLLFCLGLLLIGPEFTKNRNYVEKTKLVVAVDNSASIVTVGGDEHAKRLFEELKVETALAEKFSLDSYTFTDILDPTDSLLFNASRTNIAEVLEGVNSIYNDSNTAVVLLTDGNQTYGRDYEYVNMDDRFSIFPIVLGDTTRYEDVRITQLNANKYAFLENQFPLEITVAYDGNRNQESLLKVTMDGQQVFRGEVRLSAKNNSQRFTPILQAASVGLKDIRVEVVPFDNEKNTTNNVRTIAVEVLNEKTNIGIVSSMAHPDIGMLKKAIEANEQRSVSILTPLANEQSLQEIDVFLLYQPNASFKSVYDFITAKGVSSFTVTGQHTDWNFLNSIQNNVVKEDLGQSEEISGDKNEAFSYYDTGQFSTNDYPPLLGSLGDIMITKPHEVLIYQKIKGVALNNPLLAVIENQGIKAAYLFGENSWKWRIEAFRNNQNFKVFDDGMDKLIRFLADVTPKSRLDISYQTVFEGAGSAVINASYFDKAYVFDPNARLNLHLREKETNASREIPLLLSGTNYSADLSDLQAGDYTFTVRVEGENLAKSGSFKILDFDLEKQLLSANHTKLNRFAQANNGKLFYPSQKDALVAELIADKRFTPVQKSIQNVVSLVDFMWLLIITILFAASEWFIRKYNGLI